jgi:hypothetical protein
MIQPPKETIHIVRNPDDPKVPTSNTRMCRNVDPDIPTSPPTSLLPCPPSDGALLIVSLHTISIASIHIPSCPHPFPPFCPRPQPRPTPTSRACCASLKRQAQLATYTQNGAHIHTLSFVIYTRSDSAHTYIQTHTNIHRHTLPLPPAPVSLSPSRRRAPDSSILPARSN